MNSLLPFFFLRTAKVFVLALIVFLALGFYSAQAITYSVGDTITNPSTGATETITQLFNDADGQQFSVLTSGGNAIFTLTTVGATYKPPGGTDIYKIDSVVTNASTGLVVTINVKLSTAAAADPFTAKAVVKDESASLPPPPQPAAPAVTPPTVTSGVVNYNYKGAGGSNGSNAYGIDILGFVIGVSGSNGGNGAVGPTTTVTIPSSWGTISSTANNVNGITIGSTGGDGGSGGDTGGYFPNGYVGGAGGSGGTVNVTNNTTVSTAGNKANALYIYSSSGKGGAGGTGYIFSGGGAGGGVGVGGSVTGSNSGALTTSGVESNGIYGLSTGGSAGAGGSSFGIVGDGGNGAAGGNGGTVNLSNTATGVIITDGKASHGIFGQSIGGTGGSGGIGAGIVSFGGTGTSGGTASDVTITNSGAITTKKDSSMGIFGQSIGGGGGDSGAAGGIVALGGTGGTGNTSGVVTITNNAGGNIQTYGNDSHGIVGQSIGGGGGNTAPAGGVVTIGGKASGGGDGNQVTINNNGTIGTGGKGSMGIFAQSVGGGGGSAGGTGGLVALGGDGASGGNGKAVSVTNGSAGTITTTGINSHAIAAQSIGGGGGAGGDSGGLVSIGGKGSSGGTGGNVTVNNSGALNTGGRFGLGQNAKGILAQSIGGGGGVGGTIGGLVALGGDSGTGSNSGTVTVTNNSTGSITTSGKLGDAILAQSIGGGGGVAGTAGGAVALGGSGAAGGDASTVTVTNAGEINTSGEQARGIIAQSIGGGGGTGGTGGGIVTIGGSGDLGGKAGTVNVTNSGQINTTNFLATGIVAQSIGGGGGSGGSTGGLITIGGSGSGGGDAGIVNVTQGGSITTEGDVALGIVAQSVGGGGGNGGAAYSGSAFGGLAMGGDGDIGGKGGQTTLVLNEYSSSGQTVPSVIVTSGDGSIGILAQSVGGGGGNGGAAVQASAGLFGSVAVSLGGKGGGGGDGGVVLLAGSATDASVAAKGNVVTSGNGATGVILQSVGGGGGSGGSTVSASAAVSLIPSVSLSVALGGAGGDGGDGKSVTANLVGDIQTDGLIANGFVAQSIGGGGGSGGSSIAAAGSASVFGGGAAISLAMGGDGGSGGVGGNVDVTLGGSVTTKQAQSDAIVIQSLGGGGGNGGLTVAASGAIGATGSAAISVGLGGSGGGGGVGGNVRAVLNTDVSAAGDGSGGVIVQSIGGGGGNSGLTVAAGGSAGGVGALAVSVGVGGTGGLGGDGGLVNATYHGDLLTQNDNATGILVQSVGGGGGVASGTISASLSGSGVGGAASVGVGLGGNGGGAGDGGTEDTTDIDVQATTSGSVITGGNNSSGIVVQSVGGGGGAGGYNVTAAVAGGSVGAGAVGVGLGGEAGGGGAGRSVKAILESDVDTFGNSSTGILVQSIGGGGGNGGTNVSISVAGGGAGSGAVNVGVGGKGGGGGSSGRVEASSTGRISTDGVNSGGFVVQSLGGGGGNGGFNISVAAAGATVGSGAVNVGLGGSGGAAGHAGKVIASSSGNVFTYEDNSTGILAQSVGGGGGSGGYNVSVAGVAAGVGGGAVAVGLGGSAGGGGNAESVNLTVNNNVETEGDNSVGIAAQSLGGGGGMGAYNISVTGAVTGTGGGGVSVGLGGSGGDGGHAENVTSSVTGDISTKGNKSTGLLVQSVGGGGGNGGFDVSVGTSASGTGSVGIGISIGGTGGGGGEGKIVDSKLVGDVTTTGKNSAGVVVQSIGGGGGMGGMAIAGAVSASGGGSGSVAVGVGGSGGDGGSGAKVTSVVTGDVNTSETDSHGIIVQSLGGGGGAGGMAIAGSVSLSNAISGGVAVGIGGSGGGGGNGGVVNNTVTGSVTTQKANSVGIAAQSLGGGGGNGGLSVAGTVTLAVGGGSGSVSVGIGGSGGNGGNSGIVTNIVSGTNNTVSTKGIESTAIMAQSIGGGGGNGGLTVAGTLSMSSAGSGSVSVGIGGSGGNGGQAEEVTNTVTVTNVSTEGDKSRGVVAQSIGGGGGDGGLAIAGAISLTGGASGTVAVGIGGSGGGGGNGKMVTNTFTGNISTKGNESTGLLVESLGGGGGDGGLSVAGNIAIGGSVGAGAVGVGIGGSGGTGGTGFTVINTVTGDTISTEGFESAGVVAQSLGGGGGNGGLAVAGAITISKSGGAGSVMVGIGGSGGGGSGAGDVTSTVTVGQVTTVKDKSAGVLAQSLAGGGGNGGLSVAGAITASSAASGSVTVGIGGSGGDGGDAGTVIQKVTGNVTTGGNESSAIVAQSLGGGGGNGGLSVAGSVNFTKSGPAGAVSVGVGGSGGGGGDAGAVTNTVVGNAITDGDKSIGILAQSLGGGGGNGGLTVGAGISIGAQSGVVSVGVGGSGGDGGSSKDVKNYVTGKVVTIGGTSLINTSTIETDGKESGGVIAQSLGGGGGNGGLAVAGGISLSNSVGGTVNIGIGGSGGLGGSAGNVVNLVVGDVTTNGEKSAAIRAQSVGGGGGNGGLAIAGSINASNSGGSGAASFGIGGSGGGGGDGKDVTNTVSGLYVGGTQVNGILSGGSSSGGVIKTDGEDSSGIIAQSLGGGGGDGGLTVAGTVSISKSSGTGAVSLGIGGSGGEGGTSGEVKNYVSVDSIDVEGKGSSGVIAQSLGGGGGNGGLSVAASVTLSSGANGSVNLGIGGSGGDGGFSSDVTNSVISRLGITTDGERAYGVLAQSLGGGGGNGGLNVSAGVGMSKTSGTGSLSLGFGGSGGGGGYAGDVINSVSGAKVVTIGKESSALVAQSLGGGGGNGALNVSGNVNLSKSTTGVTGGIAVGVGGSGGNGGDAGKVTNTINVNQVSATGESAYGIVAQSLGGGGGMGGLNVSGNIAVSQSDGGAIAIGVGGSGGLGGVAKDVISDITVASVSTDGKGGKGIAVQSIGGGGGDGALNVSGNIVASYGGAGGTLGVGVGGVGGGGGRSGDVTSDIAFNAVDTRGNKSAGIVVQSVGGGGGDGGLNVTGNINLSTDQGGAIGVGIGGKGGSGGEAGNVVSTIKTSIPGALNTVRTVGDESTAIFTQSLGGGGGTGGMNVTGNVNLSGGGNATIGVGVGGFGGGGQKSGDVTLDATVAGGVQAFGAKSDGVVAQSVGGGGGDGGMNISGNLSVTKGAGSAAAATIGVGGFGGDGGSSGKVILDFVGQSVAVVNGSGVVGQSVGGGGGEGAINVAAGITAVTSNDNRGYGLVVGFGGFGGEGGDAGVVDMSVGGNGGAVSEITAAGLGNSGVTAQSVGGGGGKGGLNVSGGIVSTSSLLVGIGGFGGDAGKGQDVTLDVKANVTTNGVYFSTEDEDSVEEELVGSIFAQSVGGGGGNGGLNVTGGLAINKTNAPSLTLGIGGFGGDGSTSGNVILNHSAGNTTATGTRVAGVLAQSIAGGGGNGAFNSSSQLNFADASAGGAKDLSVVVGVGGYGGLGADAGTVTLSDNGTVSTDGKESVGVLAQSIGGGGGTGGMNVSGVFSQSGTPIIVGIGGSGGAAGNGNTVTLTRGSTTTAAGAVTTTADDSHGVEASSIGGGGGQGGMNFNIGFSLAGRKATDDAVAAQVAVGGSGDAAGNGGDVNVTNYSNITTGGEDSFGFLAQSIGGGGGNATFNMAVTYQDATGTGNDPGVKNKNMGLSLAVGGQTGAGGDGGKVTALNVGDVTTIGKNSIGVLAQSIGGGGGNAGLDVVYYKGAGGKMGITIGASGSSGGIGGDVTLTSKGKVTTSGNNAFGILAQSFGNGGGNSNSISIAAEKATVAEQPAPQSIGVAIGLAGAPGGKSGKVILNVEGEVKTTGENAHGLVAQSVGGGGGNGGTAITSDIANPSFGMSLGGDGGIGAVGGEVVVTNSAKITTTNNNSIGIVAQSVGGGGGTGGIATTGGVSIPKVSDPSPSSVTVAMGGDGGVGSNSDKVTVGNTGDITTGGEQSYGILAQSIGGGGGASGMTITTQATKTADNTFAISMNLGGDGGEGSFAGDVEVTNTGGDITTTGKKAVGIFAQSVGGGGGEAASSIIGGGSHSNGMGDVKVNLGGDGGVGGYASKVTVSNLKDANGVAGTIKTTGETAHGILAMSVGGGGGVGATTINKQFVPYTTGTRKKAPVLGFAMGGDGGEGGAGGEVVVVNEGAIETTTAGSHGIVALSIGGGGGEGGMTISGSIGLEKPGGPSDPPNIQIALGGNGGDGNSSGKVTVTNSGTIVTNGAGANGIFAQSVGGGGGNGAFSLAMSNNLLTNPKKDVSGILSSFALGGFGGDGANSGDVTVNNSGSITVNGANSYGIFAQSISGGGGSAGFSVSSPVYMAVTDGLFYTLLGGGSDGEVGKVTINNTGNITVTGAGSVASLAQSVNGGGGNLQDFLDFSQQAISIDADGNQVVDNPSELEKVIGFVKKVAFMGLDKLGYNPFDDGTSSRSSGGSSSRSAGPSIAAAAAGSSAGGAIDSTTSGNYTSTGTQSVASLSQSVGGGGGNMISNTTVDTLGNVDNTFRLGQLSDETDPEENHGGDVTITHTGNVSTTNKDSAAVVVQSIGGGGGNLLAEVKVVDNGDVPTIPTILTSKVQIGADGGSTNNGGTVTLDYTGDVSTGGARSTAILVQSIGAGGGAVDLTGLKTAEFSFGGLNGTTGHGGAITLTNTGNVTTTGVMSHGVVLQSIGGGGGFALTDLAAANILNTLNGDNSGDGDNIQFTQIGDISVSGKDSIGILAQSLGGGGGVLDRIFAGSAGGEGTSGKVKLDIQGNITASGENGVGIFAQSESSSDRGDVILDLMAGKEIKTGLNGVGVKISGGTDNVFTNNGKITEASIDGMAIVGDRGNETINNEATANLKGSVDLGAGMNTFNHKTGALLRAGNVINLGAGGQFNNSGTISLGDLQYVQGTALTGNFTQTGDAIWFNDITSSFTNDRLTISGTGEMASRYKNTFNMNQLSIATTEGDYIVASAASGLTGADFRFNTMTGLTMPNGLTFTFLNSDTEERVLLRASTGAFYWNGAVDTVWNTNFLNGQSNWTRDVAGTDYIFGTPGVASDVYFAKVAAPAPTDTTTVTLGENYTVNSLTIDNGPAVTISGASSLTIAAARGAGINLTSSALAMDLNVPVVLAGDQTWTNNSTNLFSVTGSTITSPGSKNLTMLGSGTSRIFTQIATGSGSLTKDESGTVILSNANNLYTGGTFLKNGILAVDNVAALGLGNVTVTGGILQTSQNMGGAVRTINVAANYAQTAGGTLLLQVVTSPSTIPSFDTGIAGTNYDSMRVAGAANLGGKLAMNFSAATIPTQGQRYVVVTAGAPITGAFDPLALTNLPDPYFTIITNNRTFNGTQPGNSTIVTLMKPFDSFAGLNPNESNIARAIDTNLTNLNLSGALAHAEGNTADFFDNIITGLNTSILLGGEELAASLNQLSPQRFEIFRGIAFDNNAFNMQLLDSHFANQRAGAGGLDSSGLAIGDPTLGGSLSSIRGRLLAWEPGLTPGLLSDSSSLMMGSIRMVGPASTLPEQRWNAFVSGNVTFADLNSTANVPHANYTTGGIMMGADYRLDEHWTAGGLLAYNHTDADLDAQGSNSQIDTYSPGVYGSYSNSGWYANGLVTYGYNAYDNERTVIIPGINRTANSSPEGGQYTGSLTGGYDFHLGSWTVGPVVGVNYVRLNVNSFDESGAGAANLSVQDQTADSLRSRIGFDSSYSTKYYNTNFTYRFGAQWQHEFMGNSNGMTSSFQIPNTTPFTVVGNDPSRESALVNVGVTADINRTISVFTDYSVQAGQSNYFGQSVQAGLRFGF